MQFDTANQSNNNLISMYSTKLEGFDYAISLQNTTDNRFLSDNITRESI